MQFNLLTLALLASTITDLPLISSTKSTPAEGSKISTISDSNIPKFYSSIPQSEDISKIMLPHDSIVAARTDKGKWYEGKYEGPGTPYDDGKWHEGKYEGPGTGYNNGQYHPHPRRDTQMKQDDGKWYEGKYEGPNTPYNNGQYQPKNPRSTRSTRREMQINNTTMGSGMRGNMRVLTLRTITENTQLSTRREMMDNGMRENMRDLELNTATHNGSPTPEEMRR